jgi:hypothetical protein
MALLTFVQYTRELHALVSSLEHHVKSKYCNVILHSQSTPVQYSLPGEEFFFRRGEKKRISFEVEASHEYLSPVSNISEVEVGSKVQ